MLSLKAVFYFTWLINCRRGKKNLKIMNANFYTFLDFFTFKYSNKNEQEVFSFILMCHEKEQKNSKDPLIEVCDENSCQFCLRG